VTNSVIKYVPERSDNGMRITCRAENPEMVGSALEDEMELSVMCKLIGTNFIPKLLLSF
jgi:hypothetical protein